MQELAPEGHNPCNAIRANRNWIWGDMCGEKGEPCVAYQLWAESANCCAQRFCLRAFMQDRQAADRLKSTTIGVRGVGTATGLACLDWSDKRGPAYDEPRPPIFSFSIQYSKTACVDEKSCICCIPSRLSLNSSFVSLSINYCSSHPYWLRAYTPILYTVPYSSIRN